MATEQDARRPAAGFTRAYLLLAFTALCWAGNTISGRLAVGEISPMVLVSLRWLGALLLLAVFARGSMRKDWPVLRRHLGFAVALGAVGFTLFNAIFYVAAHSTTAVNMGIIQGAIPIFVLLGAYTAYRTPVTGMQAAGVVLTVLGVVIVGSGGSWARLLDLALNAGDLLMLAAAFCYAGYTVALRKRPPVDALSLFTIMAGAAFVASIPLTVTEAALGALQWPSAKGWIVVVVVAVFPSFLAQIFFVQGVTMIGPGRAGVFVNLVPVFAAVLAVAILGEPFETYHAIALGLVLGGIWISERGRPK